MQIMQIVRQMSNSLYAQTANVGKAIFLNMHNKTYNRIDILTKIEINIEI